MYDISSIGFHEKFIMTFYKVEIEAIVFIKELASPLTMLLFEKFK